MNHFPRAGRGLYLFASALALAAFFAGCASIPEEVFKTEPYSYLEASPQIYLRLSGSSLRDISRSMNQEEMNILAASFTGQQGRTDSALPHGQNAGANIDIATLRSFFDKTKTFGAGIQRIGAVNPGVETVFIGDFPIGSVRMALAFDETWHKTEDGGYKSKKYPLYVRPPLPGFIHMAMTPPASSPATVAVEAYPARFAQYAASDIFLSAKNPAYLFSGPLPVETASIPIEAIVLTGRRVYGLGVSSPQAPSGAGPGAGGPGAGGLSEMRYLLDVYILMKDEASARAYRPVIRFLWAAIAGRVFKETPSAAASVPTLENDVYTVSGIEAKTEDLKKILLAAPALFK